MLYSFHMQTPLLKEYYLAKIAYTEQLWGGQFGIFWNTTTEVIKHKIISLPKPFKNRVPYNSCCLRERMFSMEINYMKH